MEILTNAMLLEQSNCLELGPMIRCYSFFPYGVWRSTEVVYNCRGTGFLKASQKNKNNEKDKFLKKGKKNKNKQK
jgi:hypothetical protein